MFQDTLYLKIILLNMISLSQKNSYKLIQKTFFLSPSPSPEQQLLLE